MRIRKTKWAKLIAAVFVAVSLMLLPVFSEQIIALHHANDELSVVVTTKAVNHMYAVAKTGQCEEDANSQSSKKHISCCTMSCFFFTNIEPVNVTVLQQQDDRYFEIYAEQPISRISFGLMRPPRA